MSERPQRNQTDAERPQGDEFDAKRRESTDLGYRDTEEERAYEDEGEGVAATGETPDDDDTVVGGG